MAQNLIIFDFDDTLVSTNPLFDAAKNKFASLMQEVGLFHEDVYHIINCYDIEAVKEYGYFAKACFPTALVRTYEHYCNLHKSIPDADLKVEVYKIGMWVFEQEPTVLEGAKDILGELASEFALVLLTKGEAAHQKEKIISSGLDKFFIEYFIVPDKNTTVFTEIVERHAFAPQASWSVGNSVKADINPALQVGMQAIWVQGPTWDYEHEIPLKDTAVVDNLYDIPPIIKRELLKQVLNSEGDSDSP